MKKGQGSEFDGLKEWVPGLDTRHMDWKQSARHRKLVVREFRAERNHPVVLAFDVGHRMTEPIKGVPRIDTAINAGLLLSYVSLRTGDRVGLFAFDSRVRSYLEPHGGMATFRRIQHVSSKLDYSSHETNFTLGLANLTAKLSRRTLIIVLSDFSDSTTAELMVESLGRMVRKHLVVFVSLRNPDLDLFSSIKPTSIEDVSQAVVADSFVRERHVVLENVRRLGITCIDAIPDQISTSLVGEYLRIKQRELL